MVRQGAKIEWVWTATGIVTGEALRRCLGTSYGPIENRIAFEERIKITMRYWVCLTGKRNFKRQTLLGQGLWGRRRHERNATQWCTCMQPTGRFSSLMPREVGAFCIKGKAKITHKLDTDFKKKSMFPKSAKFEALCNQSCCYAPDVVSAQPPLLQVPLSFLFVFLSQLLAVVNKVWPFNPVVHNLPNAVTL